MSPEKKKQKKQKQHNAHSPKHDSTKKPEHDVTLKSDDSDDDSNGSAALEALLGDDEGDDEGDIADGEAAEANASAGETPTTTTTPEKPVKVKTWLDHQIERMKRGVQHNMLSARMVRANYAAAKMSKPEAEALALTIEAATKKTGDALAAFIALLPAGFEGVVPSRDGTVTGARKGMLAAGTRVKLVEKSAKKFSDLFTAEQLGSLSVVSLKGAMVVLETATKERLVIASNQVESVPAEATKAA